MMVPTLQVGIKTQGGILRAYCHTARAFGFRDLDPPIGPLHTS